MPVAKTISLPDFPTPDRLAIRLKPAAERMVRKQHPWVFDASIIKQNKDGKTGDLAIIFDQKKNKFLALGLYDASSPIRIKLLQFQKSAIIDEQWLAEKIKQEKRQQAAKRMQDKVFGVKHMLKK